MDERGKKKIGKIKYDRRVAQPATQRRALKKEVRKHMTERNGTLTFKY